ncbi:hypothetical protein GCM10008944_20500 [Cytobacillus oceanisediminis]
MTVERRTSSVRKLNRRDRAVCATVGVLGTGTGAAAVFATSNQAGAVALLVMGGLSSLFALLGLVPLRWSVGSTTFDMSEVVDLVGEDLTPEQMAAAAGRVLSRSDIQGNKNESLLLLAAALQGAAALESETLNRLTAASTRLEASLSANVPVQTGNGRFELDAVITWDRGPSVGVEIKKTANTGQVFQAVKKAQLLIEAGVVQAVLIAVDGPVPQKVVSYLKVNERAIRATDVSAPASTDALMSELAALRSIAP